MGKASGGDRQNSGGVVTMSLLRSIANGLRSLFRKERVERELDEELRGFLEMAAEEKMKQGSSIRPCRWSGSYAPPATHVCSLRLYCKACKAFATQEALLSVVRIHPLLQAYDHQ